MPFSSSSFTRLASEKRGGGCVKCWSVSSLPSFRMSPSLSGGSWAPASSGAVSSAWAATFSALGFSSRRSSGVSS